MDENDGPEYSQGSSTNSAMQASSKFAKAFTEEQSGDGDVPNQAYVNRGWPPESNQAESEGTTATCEGKEDTQHAEVSEDFRNATGDNKQTLEETSGIINDKDNDILRKSKHETRIGYNADIKTVMSQTQLHDSVVENDGSSAAHTYTDTFKERKEILECLRFGEMPTDETDNTTQPSSQDTSCFGQTTNDETDLTSEQMNGLSLRLNKETLYSDEDDVSFKQDSVEDIKTAINEAFETTENNERAVSTISENDQHDTDDETPTESTNKSNSSRHSEFDKTNECESDCPSQDGSKYDKPVAQTPSEFGKNGPYQTDTNEQNIEMVLDEHRRIMMDESDRPEYSQAVSTNSDWPAGSKTSNAFSEEQCGDGEVPYQATINRAKPPEIMQAESEGTTAACVGIEDTQQADVSEEFRDATAENKQTLEEKSGTFNAFSGEQSEDGDVPNQAYVNRGRLPGSMQAELEGTTATCEGIDDTQQADVSEELRIATDENKQTLEETSEIFNAISEDQSGDGEVPNQAYVNKRKLPESMQAESKGTNATYVSEEFRDATDENKQTLEETKDQSGDGDVPNQAYVNRRKLPESMQAESKGTNATCEGIDNTQHAEVSEDFRNATGENKHTLEETSGNKDKDADMLNNSAHDTCIEYKTDDKLVMSPTKSYGSVVENDGSSSAHTYTDYFEEKIESLECQRFGKRTKDETDFTSEPSSQDTKYFGQTANDGTDLTGEQVNAHSLRLNQDTPYSDDDDVSFKQDIVEDIQTAKRKKESLECQRFGESPTDETDYTTQPNEHRKIMMDESDGPEYSQASSTNSDWPAGSKTSNAFSKEQCGDGEVHNQAYVNGGELPESMQAESEVTTATCEGIEDTQHADVSEDFRDATGENNQTMEETSGNINDKDGDILRKSKHETRIGYKADITTVMSQTQLHDSFVENDGSSTAHTYTDTFKERKESLECQRFGESPTDETDYTTQPSSQDTKCSGQTTISLNFNQDTPYSDDDDVSFKEDSVEDIQTAINEAFETAENSERAVSTISANDQHDTDEKSPTESTNKSTSPRHLEFDKTNECESDCPSPDGSKHDLPIAQTPTEVDKNSPNETDKTEMDVEKSFDEHRKIMMDESDGPEYSQASSTNSDWPAEEVARDGGILNDAYVNSGKLPETMHTESERTNATYVGIEDTQQEDVSKDFRHATDVIKIAQERAEVSVDEFNREVASLKRIVDEYSGNLKELNELRNEVHILRQKNETLDETKTKLKEELKETTATNAMLQNEIQRLEGFERFAKEKADDAEKLAQELESVRDELTTARAETRGLNEKYVKLQATLKDNKNEAEQLELQLGTVRGSSMLNLGNLEHQPRMNK
ncbi:hypothetical protein MAR_023229 [Mya arenaria]|uniref:Uncharacterized protein n=1 Tax=Mya arenaria TaxID=6604 RepID=A0ABY7DQJ5_MYAAR|nr:hypothetical protein MAR_023229 [Mya arenaria]